MNATSINRPINIVVSALGGEGGGVLANWIVDLAKRHGYPVQSTSVPGVAQRTGATIYYIEIYPESSSDADSDKGPVMSLFPTQGDVDIVVASEIVEAGRAIQRGFVTPDKTLLITSPHRAYSIYEKIVQSDGIADSEALIREAQKSAKQLVCFNMLELSRQFNSVISSALFGALAGTGALPFPREEFEQTVTNSKIAVESNLLTFAASFEQAQREMQSSRQASDTSAQDAVKQFQPVSTEPESNQGFVLPGGKNLKARALLERISDNFPVAIHQRLYLGAKRLVEYQDYAYADQYLDHIAEIIKYDSPDQSYRLTQESARYLALWMAFEDIVRVAQLKVRTSRQSEIRDEVRAEAGQYLNVQEYLCPQVEELVSYLPYGLASKIIKSKGWNKILKPFTKGKTINTQSVIGFSMFYFLVWLKPLRRKSYVYTKEHCDISRWWECLKSHAETDYEIALELANCGRLIKGYGNTRRRGTSRLMIILDRLGDARASATITAEGVAKLRDAAFADESGDTLELELKTSNVAAL